MHGRGLFHIRGRHPVPVAAIAAEVRSIKDTDHWLNHRRGLQDQNLGQDQNQPQLWGVLRAPSG